MGRARRRLLVLAGVVVVAAGGIAAWWVLSRPEEAAAAPVVVPVTVGPQRQAVSATGTVEPAARADLDFAVSGEVTRVLVAEGDEVTAGQALATVDDTLLQAQLTAAQAQLDAAQDRADDPADDSAAATAQAAVVSAESDVAAAQEAVDQATLTSPMAGTVAAVALAVGDRVTAGGAQGEDATAQVTVVSTGTFVVEAGVAAADVARVRAGLAVEIAPVGADEPVTGKVRTVGLVAEADGSGAATFPVTVDVTGPTDGVHAGSSATVTIVVSERADVLTVPSLALHTEGDRTYVNEVVDGKTVRTDVAVGESFGGQTEITAGLAEGDRVTGGGDVVFPGGGMAPGGVKGRGDG